MYGENKTKLQQQKLPLWTWTRIVNKTHGQIVANVSVADGHPKPTAAVVYQARTVDGTKQTETKEIGDILLNIFWFRRDFRFARVNPATQQVIPNPVLWVEMTNIDVV